MLRRIKIRQDLKAFIDGAVVLFHAPSAFHVRLTEAERDVKIRIGRCEGGGDPAILPMNLGGVRVPSNPDLFWRSSMSGLDGFRLGDYSSTESRPTVQGRNARTKFGVVSFWLNCWRNGLFLQLR